MVKRTLTFDNTVGNQGNSTLIIDRTGEVDLTPVFKGIFDDYKGWLVYTNRRVNKKKRNYNEYEYKQSLPDNYVIKKKQSQFTFHVNELFSAVLRKRSPQEMADFLRNNMVDPKEYHNDAMLYRLRTFHDFYERLYYYKEGNYFIIDPMDTLKPLSIEQIVKPPLTKKLSSKVRMALYDLNKNAVDSKYLREHQKIKYIHEKRVTTRPYHCTKEDYVIKSLQNSQYNSKEILRVYPISFYSDYFDILVRHDTSKKHLDNLEIVFKKDLKK